MGCDKRLKSLRVKPGWLPRLGVTGRCQSIVEEPRGGRGHRNTAKSTGETRNAPYGYFSSLGFGGTYSSGSDEPSP
jgi:hypothetical protein